MPMFVLTHRDIFWELSSIHRPPHAFALTFGASDDVVFQYFYNVSTIGQLDRRGGSGTALVSEWGSVPPLTPKDFFQFGVLQPHGQRDVEDDQRPGKSGIKMEVLNNNSGKLEILDGIGRKCSHLPSVHSTSRET
jgi:hypothetical protein